MSSVLLYSKTLLRLKPTYELISAKVLISLGYATALLAVPIFFTQVGLQDSQLGVFLGAISLSIAMISLFLPPVMEKYNQRYILIGSALLAAAGFGSLAVIRSIPIALAAVAIAQTALHINYSALIILFKDSSRNKEELTRDTGLLGSFSNLGWFLGPLLGGLMLGAAGFRGAFLLASSLLALGAFYILLFPFKTANKKRAELDIKIKKNLQFFLSKPQLKVAYVQSLGVGIWWGFCLTFIPVFMVKWGYSTAAIGVFMALTQLPLFLLEYRTVRFVPKLGFRRIFIAAYALLGVICLFSFAFFNAFSAAVLAAILIGSLALSFLEPITNLFFFSKVSSLEEEKAYPTFVTGDLIGGMLAKGAVGITLIFFSEHASFLAIGAIILLILHTSLRVR